MVFSQKQFTAKHPIPNVHLKIAWNAKPHVMVIAHLRHVFGWIRMGAVNTHASMTAVIKSKISVNFSTQQKILTLESENIHDGKIQTNDAERLREMSRGPSLPSDVSRFSFLILPPVSRENPSNDPSPWRNIQECLASSIFTFYRVTTMDSLASGGRTI